MPIVCISHRAGMADATYRQALCEGVREAMESTVNAPPNTRFHIRNSEAPNVR